MRLTEKGYTLIELMSVIAAIGILAALAMVSYQDSVIKAKLSNAKSAFDPLTTELAMYYQEHGYFPGYADAISNATKGATAGESVWASLGLSNYPSLPKEVSAVNYVPLGITTEGVATSYALVLTLSNIKAGSVDGMAIGISPSSDIVVTGIASATSESNAVAIGDALPWTYACNTGDASTSNNLVKTYFSNAGVPLVC